MDQETFVVAIEDLVDASEREAQGAPVLAEAFIIINQAEAWSAVHEAEGYIYRV